VPSARGDDLVQVGLLMKGRRSKRLAQTQARKRMSRASANAMPAAPRRRIPAVPVRAEGAQARAVPSRLGQLHVDEGEPVRVKGRVEAAVDLAAAGVEGGDCRLGETRFHGGGNAPGPAAQPRVGAIVAGVRSAFAALPYGGASRQL